MISLAQVILVVVITTLTILLTFIGIQVIYILKDFRETLKRINKIADNAEIITSAAVKPVTGISALVEGIQSSVKIAELLGHLKRGSKKVAEELPGRVEDFKDNMGEIKDRIAEKVEYYSQPKVSDPPHFFHREGTPLR